MGDWSSSGTVSGTAAMSPSRRAAQGNRSNRAGSSRVSWSSHGRSASPPARQTRRGAAFVRFWVSAEATDQDEVPSGILTLAVQGHAHFRVAV